MKEKIRSKFKELSGLIGVSGAEQEVVRYMRDHLAPLADEVFVTPIGNVIAMKKGSRPGPKVMLTAHSDEVGFVVKTILSDGFIRFEKIGFVPEQELPARKVWVMTRNGKVPGVFGLKSEHLQTEEDKRKRLTTRDIFLDVAASSREEAEAMGIRVGDRIVIQNDFMEMHNPDFICTKSVDDRIGCTVVLQVFEELQKKDFAGTLYAAITVQEESGFTGAKVISSLVEPDYALVVDTMPSIDTPDNNPERYHPVWIGKGPVFTPEMGMWPPSWFYFVHPKVREMFEDAEKKTGVKLQYLTVLEDGMSTDAPETVGGYKGGVPAGTLFVSRRYSHSAVELMNINDAVGAVKILEAIVLDNGSRTLDFV